MKVLVTGGSGFIGRYLIEALTARGDIVLSVGRSLPPQRAANGAGVEHAVTDYSEQSLAGLLDGVDAVVHLAGRRMTREDDPTHLAPFVEPNVVAVENILRAARNTGSIKQFVLASTIAVYSAKDDVPFSENRIPTPLNAYGLSKLMAEQAAELAARNSSVRVTCLRFAAVYGYGEKGTPALMRFASEASEGRTLTLQGNRNISIDQLYVRDAVSAILAALSSTNAGGTVNIGGGRSWSIEEMAQTVNRVFGNEGNLDHRDSHAAPARQPFLDISRAASQLGWAPKYSLEAGLADFLATQEKACNT